MVARRDFNVGKRSPTQPCESSGFALEKEQNKDIWSSSAALVIILLMWLQRFNSAGVGECNGLVVKYM